jgi:capsular polysaccharide biosynthesis protein
MAEEVKSTQPIQNQSSRFVLDRKVLLTSFFKRFKFIIIVTLAVMLVAAIFSLIFVRPVWKADCYLIRYSKNMATPDDLPYLYQTFDINTILETMKTRDVMLEAIDRLNLSMSPEQLSRTATPKRGGRSNILIYSVQYSHPDSAAIIANTLAESFIDNTTKLQNSSVVKIYNYYLSQRKVTKSKIDSLEIEMEKFRTRYGIIDIENESEAKFQQLNQIELEQTKNRLNMTELKTKIEELDTVMGDVPEEIMIGWVYNGSEELKLLDVLRTRYTDENPKVQKTLFEINELQQRVIGGKKYPEVPDETSWGPNNMLQAYEADMTRYQGELSAATQLQEDYETDVRRLKRGLRDLNYLQKTYFELKRLLDLNKDILRVIEGRISESKMAMESNTSDFEILEPAKTPNWPQGVNKKIVVLGAGIFVFALLVVVIIGREILDFSIKSSVDIAEFCNIPVIGSIPNEETVASDVFYRSIQSTLADVIQRTNDYHPAIITLGSIIPETGKSFLIQEMINLLLDNNKKVLYIDSVNTVTDEIMDFVINPAIYNSEVNVHFNELSENLSKGYFYLEENLSRRIISKENMINFYRQISKFDYVIWELFDYSQNAYVFTSISTTSDMLILVNRFRFTSKFQLRSVVHQLKEKGVENICAVINFIEKEYYNEKM